MRRVFPILAAAFILALCVVPASALSNGDGYTYRAPVQFETFSGSLSDVAYTWPFNAMQQHTSEAAFSYDGGAVTGYQSFNESGDIATGFFSFPMVAGNIGATEVLTLEHYSDQIINKHYLEDFVLLPSECDLSILRVVISADLGYLETSPQGANASDFYKVSYSSFSGEFVPDPENNICYIGDWLYDMIDGCAAQYDFQYVNLTNLKVQVYVSRNDVSTPGFMVCFKPTANKVDSYYQWLFERKVSVKVYTDPNIDPFNWLLRSADAFLNFQLVPGFSLNKLFEVVLTIAVVLWFIKVFS